MNYEVAVAYGNEGLIEKIVNGVDEIVVEDEAYFLYDTNGDMIFSAPILSVVYIQKV
ncbi:hypothetical protein ACMGD3_07385 [Lysinibacillus sphaericus]|uniref:hypothetical protein n=1 Tax=Lysinibacillus sphaericus TaxID=1421 RepID=UPI001C5D01E2